MNISSRTPEGLPSQCDLCGAENDLEYSTLGEDAPCPNCGHLLWKSHQILNVVRKYFEATGYTDQNLNSLTTWESLYQDSLGFVELLMELEDEFGIVIPDEANPDLRTVGDLVRFVESRTR
jgi:acyl carrier protein